MAAEVSAQTDIQIGHDLVLPYLHLLHPHYPRNVNVQHDDQLTVGQRVADKVASTMGSWRFIIIQSCILGAWIVLNVIGLVNHWDPYPFILLNLALSFQAAYAAPIIMMSQNRQAEKDRLQADEDFQINCKAEMEIANVHDRLHELTEERLTQLLAVQEEQVAILRQIRDSIVTETQ
jgi:uncharacterized membrane protein